MSTYAAQAAATYANDLKTLNPEAQQKRWLNDLTKISHYMSPLRYLEGKGEHGRAIATAYSLKKGPGDEVRRHTSARLGGRQQVGDKELLGTEQAIKFRGFWTRLDEKTFATSFTRKYLRRMSLPLEALSLQALGEHKGERMENETLHSLADHTQKRNRLIIGSHSSVNFINATDRISTASIEAAAAKMESTHAEPANIAVVNSSPVPAYCFLLPHVAMNDLHNDTAWTTAERDANVRGEQNTVFKGGWMPWRNVSLLKHVAMNDDAPASQGSLMHPFGYLGEAIDSTTGGSTATFNLKLGGTDVLDDTVDWTENFPNFQWTYYEDQPTGSDRAWADNYGDTWYLLIANNGTESYSGADDGDKFGFVSYVANPGTHFTCTGILAASAANARKTKVGRVTYSGGSSSTESVVFEGKIAAGHPVGAMVMLANNKGQTIGRGYILGKHALIREYGQVGGPGGGHIQQLRQLDDYGRVKGYGYLTIFGQSAWVDTNGLPRNFTEVWFAVSYEGIDIPTITLVD